MSAEGRVAKRPDNVTAIAIYHLIVGAMKLLGAVALLILGALPVMLTVYDEVALIWSLIAIGVGAAILGAFGIVSLVVGFGLLKMCPWARWAAVVLAVLGLPSFPVGTVVSVLILIYLLGDDGRQAFEGE